tara:strand:+ start:756 stop:1019 length:264 start_codon:yes stop_codon:yes gene_type:complete
MKSTTELQAAAKELKSVTDLYALLVESYTLRMLIPNVESAKHCEDMANELAEQFKVSDSVIEQAKADALEQVRTTADNRISIQEDEE